MSHFTISAVIITYNEEKNIGRCLESLVGIADEVIVVDSFSNDKTREICSAGNIRFFQFPWAGYAESKNYGNNQATGDYIFSIDADEALSDELRRSLLHRKENLQGEAFSFNRLTNYCGQWIRHGGWYPDVKTRLFQRSQAQWKGEVHEDLIFVSPPQVKHLAGDLLHYSYPTIASHVSKSLKYAMLVARRDYVQESRKNLFMHGILKPSFFFFKQYFLRLGFLDGYYGFIIAVVSGVEKFMRFAGYIELRKNSK